jgi:DNA-binding SARP family transcriptional activator
MQSFLLFRMILTAAAFAALTISSVAENRKEAPEWSYSDVKDFIESKSTDRSYQKYLLRQARDNNRAVKRIKDYKKLNTAEVIAIKWDCFDDFPHDWNMINYVLMERLFEANKEKP